MTIKGVTIGDRFQKGKHTICEVVDFEEIKSLVSGEIKGYRCIAKSTSLSTNTFEVPFATVVRNRANN